MQNVASADFEPIVLGRKPNRWGVAVLVLGGMLLAHVTVLRVMGRIWGARAGCRT